MKTLCRISFFAAVFLCQQSSGFSFFRAAPLLTVTSISDRHHQLYHLSSSRTAGRPLPVTLYATLDESYSGNDVKNKSSKKLYNNNTRYPSPSDEENKDAHDYSYLSPKKQRTRSADFPSVFYNTRGEPVRENNKVRIRFRDAFGKDRTMTNTEKPPKSRVVNVPQPPDRSPLLKRLFLSVIGASLEPALTDTERLLPTAKRTRLLTGRTYARKEAFAAENITVPPSLDDLAAIPRVPFEGFWISTPFRMLVFFSSYWAFPFLTRFLDIFVTMPPSELDDITSKFGPGISILYGTFISLTLSILYNRQRDIQDHVATESSLLVLQTRTLLSLFQEHRELAIEAGQCAADQIRTLVRSSRGAELMMLMYSDPYARMLELVDQYEDELFRNYGNGQGYQTRIAYARDVIKDLVKARTQRLSDECQALPPTHFLILNSLTILILLGYTISILPTVPIATGEPSNESSLLFGALSAIYVLFYNFADDLNNPFNGVYQVRRSCTASHLLEAKWLIANHPFLRDQVDFDEVVQEEDDKSVQIRSPGLGDFWFEREDIYIDADADAGAALERE